VRGDRRGRGTRVRCVLELGSEREGNDGTGYDWSNYDVVMYISKRGRNPRVK